MSVDGDEWVPGEEGAGGADQEGARLDAAEEAISALEQALTEKFGPHCRETHGEAGGLAPSRELAEGAVSPARVLGNSGDSLEEVGRVLDYAALVREEVAAHGWVVQGVFPVDGDGDYLAYTVGLTAAGLPELAVSGMRPDSAQVVLKAAARAHLQDELTTDVGWEPAEVGAKFRVVENSSAVAGVACMLYGRDNVRVTQLVWPDDRGWYPGDIGWDPRTEQEVFPTA